MQVLLCFNRKVLLSLYFVQLLEEGCHLTYLCCFTLNPSSLQWLGEDYAT